MNISNKEIERITALTDLLHHQWADRDAQLQATIDARKVYREAMAKHGYNQPIDDEFPVVEFVRSRWIRLRVFVGSLKSVGSEE